MPNEKSKSKKSTALCQLNLTQISRKVVNPTSEVVIQMAGMIFQALFSTKSILFILYLTFLKIGRRIYCDLQRFIIHYKVRCFLCTRAGNHSPPVKEPLGSV